jgi:hypothetical protein
MTLIHFNAYATPIQTKRYSVKDLEVQEQLLTDEFDETDTIRPDDSISQQGRKVQTSEAWKPISNDVVKINNVNVNPVISDKVGTPEKISNSDRVNSMAQLGPKPMPLLHLLAKANMSLEKSEPEESNDTAAKAVSANNTVKSANAVGAVNTVSAAKAVSVDNTRGANNAVLPANSTPSTKLSIVSTGVKTNVSPGVLTNVASDVIHPIPLVTQSVQSTQRNNATTLQATLSALQAPQLALQASPVALQASPLALQAPLLPLPDRLVSTVSRPSSQVGSVVSDNGNNSVVSHTQPIFAIDQHHWNDLVNRLHNQECEQEKLKGQVKRLMLMLQTTQQSAKRDATDLRTELHVEMEDGVKKAKNEIIEYTQVREFECKHYTDKRLKDEMNDVKFQIDILSQQLGSLHTTQPVKSKSQDKSSVFIGIIFGLFMLYHLSQWLNYLLKNPALHYYSVNNTKPFYPS